MEGSVGRVLDLRLKGPWFKPNTVGIYCIMSLKSLTVVGRNPFADEHLIIIGTLP